MGIVVSDGRIFENGVFHEAKETKVESADAPKDEQKNDSDAEKPANKGGKGKKKPFVVIDGSQITPEEKK